MEKKIVYHVDRRGALLGKGIGDTIKVCSIENPYYSSIIVGNQISIHGNSYLNLWGVGCKEKSMDSLWELFTELVRLKSYPQYGSRYHAMFGFEDINDLICFVLKHSDDRKYDRKIYELSVSDFLQRDMNQLSLAAANVQIQENNPNTFLDNLMIKQCNDYWNGTQSSDPLIDTLIYNTAKITNIIEFNKLQHMK